MANSGTIRLNIDLDTKRFATEAKNVAKQGKIMGSQFAQNFKATMAGVFAGNIMTTALTSVVSFVREATTEFKQLDTQVKNIGTLGFEGFQKFHKIAIESAKGLLDTPSKVAEGYYQAISAGVKGTAQDIAKFTEIASQAGVAGLSDTKTAVDGLTSVINAYGLSTKETRKVADTFFAGIKLGKTTFNEMAASVANYTPMASAMEVTFDQTTAALARLTAMGTPTAMAGTQLAAFFSLLQKGNTNLDAALEKTSGTLGYTMDSLREKLKQPVEAGGGLINTMRALMEVSEQAGVQLGDLTGRKEATNVILQLAGNVDKYTLALKTYEQTQKEIQNNASLKAFEVASKSLEVQFMSLKNNVIAIFMEIYEGIVPILAKLSQILVSIFNKPAFQQGIEFIKQGFFAIGNSIEFLINNTEFLIPVLGLLTANFIKLKYQLIASKIHLIATAAAEKGLTITQYLLNNAMRANLFGIIVTALGMLVAGLIYAWKNSETFRNTIISVWEAIKKFYITLYSYVLKALKFVAEWVGKIVIFFIKWLNPIGFVYNALKLLGVRLGFIGDILDKVVGGIKSAITWFKNLISTTEDASDKSKKKKIEPPFTDDYKKKLEENDKKNKEINKNQNELNKTKEETIAINKDLANSTNNLNSEQEKEKETVSELMEKYVNAKNEIEKQKIYNKIIKLKIEETKFREKLEDLKKKVERDVFFEINGIPKITNVDLENDDAFKKSVEARKKELNDLSNWVKQKSDEINKQREEAYNEVLETQFDYLAVVMEQYGLESELDKNGVKYIVTQKKQKEQAEDTVKTLNNTYLKMGESLGKLIAEGDLTWKKFGSMMLANTFDLATQMITIYTPQIIAAFMSQLGPFGLPAALIAIGTVTGLLQAAKPKGFKKGGETGGSNPNEPAGIVHQKEFVIPYPQSERYKPLLYQILNDKVNVRQMKNTNYMLIQNFYKNYVEETQNAGRGIMNNILGNVINNKGLGINNPNINIKADIRLKHEFGTAKIKGNDLYFVMKNKEIKRVEGF